MRADAHRGRFQRFDGAPLSCASKTAARPGHAQQRRLCLVPWELHVSVAFDVRLIAHYLPQFHPVPENDEWWGKGFTEWHNVARAKPLFPGHYQPHLPTDLGFYDLRVPEAREAQAELAREYGIAAFCYYHYWFAGRRILDRPFREVLTSGKPDFPFCLCWANENWTRRWDGKDGDVLLGQRHSIDDDRAHIEALLPAFGDERYVRIHGRPLFLVYRTELLPDPRRTADIWREAVRKAGLGDLYLARVEHFKRDVDPASIGFDAGVDFAPDARRVARKFQNALWRMLYRFRLAPRAWVENELIEYAEMAAAMMGKPAPGYVRFDCVCPGWDNSPRRTQNAGIFVNSTPSAYEKWLRTMIDRARDRFDDDGRIVFINAWNEWGEGCHLEPDAKWQRAYLEATRSALGLARRNRPLPVARGENVEDLRRDLKL